MPDPASSFPTSVDSFAADSNSSDRVYGIATAVENIQKVLKIVGSQSLAGTAQVQITGTGLNVGSGAQAYEAGDIAISRESAPSAGVVYFGNTLGTKYLYYDGTQFVFNGGKVDAANGYVDGSFTKLACSYQSGNGSSTATLNAWVATTVTCTGTISGTRQWVQWAVPVYNGQVSAAMYVGMQIDGVLQGGYQLASTGVANQIMIMGNTIVTNLAAGSHTFTVVFQTNASVIALDGSGYSTINVLDFMA